MNAAPNPRTAGHLTTLRPTEAIDTLAQNLSAFGAQVTTTTGGSITGTVTVQRNPNAGIAILLLFFCLIPGIVYLVVARSTVVEPFSLRITAEADGALVTFTGQGAGYAIARRAALSLPAITDTAPSPEGDGAV